MNDSKYETLKHIVKVRDNLNKMIESLLDRQTSHDMSKLKSPELELFDVYTKKLRRVTYGSKKYKQYLQEMKPALSHHYECNRHHPEHFEYGILDMNLIDICEMFCDWFASCKRHEDGDIFKSIEINKERFELGDQLESIFINTAKLLEVRNEL